MAITAITTLLPAVNEAVKTAAGILHLVKDADTKQKVIDLQSAILDLQHRILQAQAEQDELARAKGELERKLLEYERWHADAARYELRDLADGIFVYSLKADQRGNEPTHYLCPHCFGERKKSILQRPGAGYTNYVCHACKLDIRPVKPSYPAVGIQQSGPLDGFMG
jgi:hypothetical protein